MKHKIILTYGAGVVTGLIIAAFILTIILY